MSIPETLSCGTPVISNTVPTNSYIINSHQLGIAKDNWDEHDLKEIIANNSFYVKNDLLVKTGAETPQKQENATL